METFIQPKITGYRQLSEREAELMNRIKKLGADAEQLVTELRSYHRGQRNAAAPATSDVQRDEMARLDQAEPERWLSMGRTSMQLAVMQMVRSVAQPAG